MSYHVMHLKLKTFGRTIYPPSSIFMALIVYTVELTEGGGESTDPPVPEDDKIQVFLN